MSVLLSALNLAENYVKTVKKELLDTMQWNDQESKNTVTRRTYKKYVLLIKKVLNGTVT
jgi:hypothetical protein